MAIRAPRLNLIVLRVSDIDRASEFFQLLGCEFSKHAHGSGPPHYAFETADCVFELYPASTDQPVSMSTRLGFAVDELEETIARISQFPGAAIVTPLRESPWGRRAVVADPDGHRIELVELPLDH